MLRIIGAIRVKNGNFRQGISYLLFPQENLIKNFINLLLLKSCVRAGKYKPKYDAK
jgi:hypothetical protein